MTTDPATAAGLVTREVRAGSREGVDTRIVVAGRTYPTDATDLWDVLTNPERVARWFAPVSGDLEVGGRYQLGGQSGGVVERCDAPKSFSVTWEMGPTVSWLQITLDPVEGGTVLELVHEAPLDPERWAQFGPGAVGVGWDLALLGLGLLLQSSGAAAAEEFQEWPLTPEGKAFVTAAAGDWAAAAVASGDGADAAAAAAASTVAFYTTVPGA